MAKYTEIENNLPAWLSAKRIENNRLYDYQTELPVKLVNTTKERRTPFQKDIDIITFDSAFRRLAHKTQVALNPAKDFTRTRLTHSLEVHRIGKQLARIFSDVIWKDKNEVSSEVKRCFEDAVGAACLVHDIGHPAFGHKGEKVLDSLLKSSSNNEMQFEGNKQNFRLLTGNGFKEGLNLTYAVLDGISKYKISTHPLKGKGFYAEDVLKYGLVTATTGCIYYLNPISYFVEMSDDIAFIASDTEDALKQGWLTQEKVISILKESNLTGYHDGWKTVNPNDWGNLLKRCKDNDCYESLKTAIIKGLLMHCLCVLNQLSFDISLPENLPQFLHEKLVDILAALKGRDSY